MIDLRGGDLVELLRPGVGARIGVARSVGDLAGATGAACAWVLVESGDCMLTVNGRSVHAVGRDSVFAEPGWSLLAGPRCDFAVAGDAAVTVVWRACDRPLEHRIIDPGAVQHVARGDGTTRRQVRTYVDAGPLIVGETLNPPGGWSSWPPHSHAHEEIYLYRFEPRHGFGVHVDLAECPQVVRDGDVVRITRGEHPVVAAPGCAMYYLWALAGDTDVVDTQVDPQFA